MATKDEQRRGKKRRRCKVCGKRATRAIRMEGPRGVERIYLCGRCSREVGKELDRRKGLLPVKPGRLWLPNPFARPEEIVTESIMDAAEGAGVDVVITHTFPEEDWQRATGLGWVNLPYQEAQRRIEEAIREGRRRAVLVLKVVIGVDEMLRRLRESGLGDTRQNRLTVATQYALEG